MDKSDNKIRYYFENIEQVNTREAYEFFKENRNKPIKAIDDFQKFKRGVQRIFMLIADNIVKEEEGVYIPRLGYFTNIPLAEDRLKTSLLMKKIRYGLMFFPDCEIYPWTMDKTAFFKVTSEMNMTRNKYKTLFSLTETHRLFADSARKLYNTREKNYNYNPKFNYIDELT